MYTIERNGKKNKRKQKLPTSASQNNGIKTDAVVVVVVSISWPFTYTIIPGLVYDNSMVLFCILYYYILQNEKKLCKKCTKIF